MLISSFKAEILRVEAYIKSTYFDLSVVKFKQVGQNSTLSIYTISSLKWIEKIWFNMNFKFDLRPSY